MLVDCGKGGGVMVIYESWATGAAIAGAEGFAGGEYVRVGWSEGAKSTTLDSDIAQVRGVLVDARI